MRCRWRGCFWTRSSIAQVVWVGADDRVAYIRRRNYRSHGLGLRFFVQREVTPYTAPFQRLTHAVRGLRPDAVPSPPGEVDTVGSVYGLLHPLPRTAWLLTSVDGFQARPPAPSSTAAGDSSGAGLDGYLVLVGLRVLDDAVDPDSGTTLTGTTLALSMSPREEGVFLHRSGKVFALRLARHSPRFALLRAPHGMPRSIDAPPES